MNSLEATNVFENEKSFDLTNTLEIEKSCDPENTLDCVGVDVAAGETLDIGKGDIDGVGRGDIDGVGRGVALGVGVGAGMQLYLRSFPLTHFVSFVGIVLLDGMILPLSLMKSLM